jgi:single-strand DNA-binding protein
MNCVNQVFVSGTAGKDAEFRAFASGTSIATFSIATSESRKDAQGNWKEETTWVNVKTFGRLAERARDEVKKGTRVFLEGKLTVEAWDDKKTGEKRSKTVIVALSLSVVASARASSEASMAPAAARTGALPPAPDRLLQSTEITAEDLPF